MALDPNRPTVPQILPYAQEIYRRHAGGCCLHIALHDGNLNDGNIQFCHATALGNAHGDCLLVAICMLRMSMTQRRKLARLACRVDDGDGWSGVAVHRVD